MGLAVFKDFFKITSEIVYLKVCKEGKEPVDKIEQETMIF